MGVLGVSGILGVLEVPGFQGSQSYWRFWGFQGSWRSCHPRGLRGAGGPGGSQEDSGGWVPLTTHPHSLADHNPDVVLWVLVGLVAVGALLTGAVTYRIYYHKKKIRRYQLRQQQRQLEMKPMRSRQDGAPLHDGGAPP